MMKRPWSIAPAAFGVAFLAAGCGIKRDVLDAELASVRAEMHEADSAVAQQLGDRMDRVDQRIDGLEVMSGRVEDFEQELQTVRRDFDADIETLQAAIRFNAPVHFDYDSDLIRDEDKPLLDRFATIVGTYYPVATVTIEGFADPAGDAEYNLWLGERRATAVMNYLTNVGGLTAHRVRAVSYGESRNRQINTGAWGDNGLANRRVSLVIDYSSEASGLLAGASESSK